MKLQNQYDYLKHDCLEDVEPVEATASWPVTDSREEAITITTALLPEGAWVYGYIVRWAKGGVSVRQPTAKNGKFRTQREAKLHAVGFMKMYLSYFTADTQEALRIGEASLNQGNLFE